MLSIVGLKIKHAVDVRQLGWKRAFRTRIEIGNQERARSRAIALPEFRPVNAIIGTKIERPIDLG